MSKRLKETNSKNKAVKIITYNGGLGGTAGQ